MRFAYDNADAYLRWQVHSYIVVEGQDADELDERIDEFHAWHRKNALPKYVTIAHEVAQRFSDGLSHADLVWGYDSAREPRHARACARPLSWSRRCSTG